MKILHTMERRFPQAKVHTAELPQVGYENIRQHHLDYCVSETHRLIDWLTETTGSATVLAMATLVAILPGVILGPFAGTLVDRWNRRIVMLAADGMIAAADRACLLVNHTRFGHTALHRLADLAEFDAIISDKAPGTQVTRALAEAGLTLTLAQQEDAA